MTSNRVLLIEDKIKPRSIVQNLHKVDELLFRDLCHQIREIGQFIVALELIKELIR